MDEFLRSFLLVLCGIGAVVLLVITYLWYFVFGKSLRGVLMAGLSILMNRDSTIDMDADVEIKKRPEDAKKEMTQEVAMLDFDNEVAEYGQRVPDAMMDEGFGAQSVVDEHRMHEFVSSSFSTNRFRRLIKGVVRPFLRERIEAQSDAPAKNVQYGQETNDSQ